MGKTPGTELSRGGAAGAKALRLQAPSRSGAGRLPWGEGAGPPGKDLHRGRVA